MASVKPFDLNSFDLKTLKNLAIIASAGTGKTYNICGIVDKLVNDGIDLKEILIVTYTEKAAEELKNRIREKLPTADIDNATIGTIHSFCQKTIEEFCIASGKPSKLVLIDESDASDFAKQYIRTKDLLIEIAEIKKFARELGDDLDVETQLVDKFCAIANSYYLDKDNKEVPAIISLTEPVDPDIIDAFENIVSGKAFSGIISPAIANALAVLKGSTNPKLNELYKVLDGSKTFKFDGRTYKASKSFTPAEADAFNLLKGAKEELSNRLSLIKYVAFKHAKDFYIKWQEEKEKLSVQTYNDMIRSVREEVVNGGPLLKALKAKYKIAIIDEFQDTNQKQWDIFKNVFLCENHNIIVVLDPKQSIYAFQGSDTLVSDAAVNEIAASGGEVCSLLKNYRASEGIIVSTGHFFKSPNALDPKMSFEPSTCGKDYFRFKYNGSENIPSYWICTDFETEEPVSEEEDDSPKEKLSEQDKFAKIVCQTIIDCCTKDDSGNTRLKVERESDDEHSSHYEDNVSFRDFTILARTRTEMPAIRKALEESGIPYMQYKDTSVFNGIECANWIAVLEAINTPDFSGRNRAKFRKALYTSFFGYSLEEINSSEFDKDNIPEILLFDNWRAIANDASWEDLINGIIIDTGLEDKLSTLKDLKTLGIFKQVADYCIDYLAKSQSLDALIINLKKLQKDVNDEEAGDSDSSLAAITTDFDCVKLMTIHASKGLEFPVVISFGGFKKPYTAINAYNYHDGGDHKLSFENPDDYGVGNYSAEKTEEWQRLFYVAYTRAKYVLILPNYEKVGDDFIKESIEDYINAPYPYRPLQDNKMEYDDLKLESSKILKSNTKTVSNSITESDQKDVLKSIISSKKTHASYKHAYSSLSHHKAKPETMTDDKLTVSEAEDKKEESLSKYDVAGKQIDCAYDSTVNPIILSEDFPAGAGLGNAIHEVFELIDYNSTIRTDDNELLINTSFAKEGFGKTCKWLDDIYTIVESVINAKLPEIHGKEGTGNVFCLNELGFADRKNEVEFNFNKESERLRNYFNGFIDLIFKRGEYYSILDWKSDKLREEFSSYSDGKIVKDHIDELYSIQRVLYSYCLIKWLKNFYKDLTEQEIFEQHFGGVYYVCIRGCNEGTGNGIYAQTWETFADLEEAYYNIVKERIGA